MAADMLQPPGSPSDLAAALRIARMAAVARLVPFMASGHVAATLVLATAFWRNGPHGLLLSAPPIVAGLYGLILLGTRAALRADRGAAARLRHEMFGLAAACVLGIVSGLLVAVLIPQAADTQLMIVGGACVALVSGSAAAAECPAAALAFLAPMWLGAVIGALHRPPSVYQPIYPGRGVAITACAAATCLQIALRWRRHRDACLDRIALDEQRGLVKLLLSDFESGAADWLWEIDEAGYMRRIPDRLVAVSGVSRDRLREICWPALIRAGAAAPGPAQENFAQLQAAWRRHEPFRDIVVPFNAGPHRFWAALSGKPVRDAQGRYAGFRGVGSDVTQARASAARIEHMARHDGLTGLPNRLVFTEALDAACRHGGDFCVLYLDLDRFKAINDTHGHGMGDRVLAAAAARLGHAIRQTDLVARIGGDEFAILLRDTGAEAGARLAARLIEVLSAPFQIDAVSLGIGASIGIATADRINGQAAGGDVARGADGAAMMRAADLALYDAKAASRGCVRVFDAAMDDAARARDDLLLDLRGALARGELGLRFQPIVDLASGHVVAVEALARWCHPRRGDVPAASFIPAAEEGGLIGPIGAWVLREACQAAAALPASVRMSVNISSLQLRAGGLMEAVQAALRASGLAAARLELEFTETVFAEADAATPALLHRLGGMGVTLTLDQFGAGHSSLSDLRLYPFDAVKIDRAFVRDMAPDQRPMLVRAMVQLADNLGMRSVAVGVETRQQMDVLRALGCGCAQGTLLCRPVEAAQLPALVDAAGMLRPALTVSAAAPCRF